MENKKLISIIAVVFVVWMAVLTVLYFSLSQSIKSTANNTSASATGNVSVNEMGSSAKLSAFTLTEGGKIFGKYNAEDFSSFNGQFVSKIVSGGNTVLIVSGYLNLKPEMLAKETQSGKLPAPYFQMETKYIEIGKDTKIVDVGGNAVKVDDLAPEDSLMVVAYDPADYPSAFMLASQITVTKKVWPTGENPFK